MRDNKSFKNNKGAVAVLLTLLILSVTLSIALGLSAIFVDEMKSSNLVMRSASAFYAADAGAEYALYSFLKNAKASSDIITGSSDPVIHNLSFPSIGINNSYEVRWNTAGPRFIESLGKQGTVGAVNRKIRINW